MEYRADAEKLELFLVAPHKAERDVAAALENELPNTVAELDPSLLKNWALEPEPERFWVGDLALHPGLQ